MEKYRAFADAPTGIQPFIASVRGPKKTLPLTIIMFPIRLILFLFFFLLLVIIDTVRYIFYALYLQIIPRLLLIEVLTRLCLRGLFFFLGHIIPTLISAPGFGQRAGEADGPVLQRGDIIAANLQTPWDAMVLEAALGLSYYAIAIPVYRPARGVSPSQHRTAHVKVFLPSPLQRWRVWSHLCWEANSTTHLTWQAAAMEDHQAHAYDVEELSPSILNVGLEAQYAANRAGVPLIYFLEGTTSNGKGVLQAPAFRCYSRAAFAPSSSPTHHTASERSFSEMTEESIWTASLTYETPALCTITATSLLSVLFRASALLYGSASPFFPRAFVYMHDCPLPYTTKAFSEELAGGSPATSSSTSASTPPFPSSPQKGSTLLFQVNVSGKNLNAVREALCRFPKGSASIKSVYVSSARKTLTVGAKEKLGFIRKLKGEEASSREVKKER